MTVEPAVVAIDGLRRGFGRRAVLDGVSLSIGPGCVYGLVGLNGAGKTTLLRVILGLLKPDAGVVSVLGADPWKHEPALYRRVGTVLEHDGFSGNLTVAHNMDYYAAARGLNRAKLTQYLEEFWADSDLLASQAKVRYLSRGQKVQCGICRAFAGWPQVVILDEPTVALDLHAYDRLARLVRYSRENGGTVVVSSHQFAIVDELCDRVGMLENGVVQEIEMQAVEDWFIRCGDGAEAILADCTKGTPRQWENGWRVRLAEPDADSSLLVQRLVQGGVAVFEVRPLTRELRGVMRNRYAPDTVVQTVEEQQ